VFIPKCRRRTLYGELRRHLGEVFRQLAVQKESRIEEGHLLYGEQKGNFVGQHFWARGYFVSTVGRDERMIREYIRKPEQEDARLD
jgi:putative transposase